MGVTIEWHERADLTGTLRGGPPHQTFGDPYTASGTVVVEGDTASVTGFRSDGFDLADWARFRELLRHRARSARWLCIERRRGDRITYRRYRL
ncbi:hypothetical protein DEM34_14925 [Spiribacter halobius]|uniref:Uncharacterized protein n=1 Tax=Sediminicurvatus halobius TaxID=2182432 RepID=A0A2U2MXT3_9GAMM|nr:hypothetical protein DEM34_14925 [Spiribacter halobius]